MRDIVRKWKLMSKGPKLATKDLTRRSQPPNHGCSPHSSILLLCFSLLLLIKVCIFKGRNYLNIGSLWIGVWSFDKKQRMLDILKGVTTTVYIDTVCDTAKLLFDPLPNSECRIL